MLPIKINDLPAQRSIPQTNQDKRSCPHNDRFHIQSVNLIDRSTLVYTYIGPRVPRMLRRRGSGDTPPRPDTDFQTPFSDILSASGVHFSASGVQFLVSGSRFVAFGTHFQASGQFFIDFGGVFVIICDQIFEFFEKGQKHESIGKTMKKQWFCTSQASISRSKFY